MKQSKNAIALQANEQALEKAKADLAKAQKAVLTLGQKIPELERACEALRVLCGEKPKGRAEIVLTESQVDPAYSFHPKTVEIEANFPFPDVQPPPSMDGITSIPAPREPKITPSAGNVANQVRREGGFS